MTVLGVNPITSKTWINSDINNSLTYEIPITPNKGVSKIDLEMHFTPVGVGAFTLAQLVNPIASIKISDNNKDLFDLKAYELVLLDFLLNKNNPAQNLLYNDGTGYTPVTSSTVVATGQEIVSIITLPVRIGKAQPTSKIVLEINLVNTTTKGWSQIGDFATSSTSITGKFLASVTYDSDVIETFIGHSSTEQGIGTDFMTTTAPPEKRKVRYCLLTDIGFWASQNGATNPYWFFNEAQFRQNLNYIPFDMNRFAFRQYMQNYLDMDTDIILADTVTVAKNYFFFILPDLVMEANSRFALKNDSSLNVRQVIIEVLPDPAQSANSALLSPAGARSLMAKLR